MTTTHDWKALHDEAYADPKTPRQRWIVSLIKGIEKSINEYTRAHTYDPFPDGVISEAFGEVISGARSLLNADFGGRLDGGTLDAKLCDLAQLVRFDLDINEVIW
jgi:hypothetical protein